MDFFFPDPDQPRQPPEKTRILELRAEPHPDGGRVRVTLELTPFEKRPHIELTLFDAAGENLDVISIIEPMSWKLELTLHVRPPEPGAYALEARLFYPDGPQADPVRRAFSLPAA